MHGLVDLNCNIFLQPQPIPLVIYCNDLTLESLTRGITIFPKESTIESPFKVHRILSEDEVFILGVKGNPLAVNLDFGTRDVEDNAFVVAFL